MGAAVLVLFVALNYQTDDVRPATNDVSPQEVTAGPKESTEWIRDLGGEFRLDGNGNVVRIDLSDKSVDEQDLRALRNHPHLTSLLLSGEGVSDAACDHLPPQLTDLELTNTSVTDEALLALGRLQLKTLTLDSSPVSDEGVSKLSDIQSLTQLSLAHTNISNLSGSAVRKLPKLFNLCVNHTDFGDEGLVRLSGTNLNVLELSGCPVTNDGLKHLKSLGSIETLCLNYCPQITDDGVESLTHLPKLHTLLIYKTGVTPAGLRQLFKLPKLKAIHLAPQQVDAPLKTQFGDRLVIQ